MIYTTARLSGKVQRHYSRNDPPDLIMGLGLKDFYYRTVMPLGRPRVIFNEMSNEFACRRFVK